MILYKNVDICDLESIVSNGILSIDECGNDNWADGKRADNATSVVYLFSPLGNSNSFPHYGAALLEVDCSAQRHEISERDAHRKDYAEYIAKRVAPCEIKRIIIPKLFKPYINIPQNIDVCWCDMEADYWGDNGKEKCTDSILEKFSQTAPLQDSTWFNFFRGENEDRTVIDLYNIRYVF